MTNPTHPAILFSLPEGVTQDTLAAWKQKHGRVHWITVKRGEDKLLVIARRPDIAVLSAAASVMGKDPIKAGLVLFDNLVLWAHPDIKASDELKVAVTKELGKLWQNYETELGEF